MGWFYPKPLPSWEEGPKMEDEWYPYSLIDKKVSVRVRVVEQTAREEGYSFGVALGSVFTLHTNNTGYAKIIVVARQFAKWAGYRGLDDGSEYIDGFVDGIFASQPKQITEVKPDVPDR